MKKNLNPDLLIESTETIKSAMKKMTSSSRKCLLVNVDHKLLGTISDGDIRNALLHGASLQDPISEILNKKPFTLSENDALNTEKIKKVFVDFKFDLIPVLDSRTKKIKEILFWEDFLLSNERPKKVTIPVFIMAGGLGSRLKPFTDVLPKPLIPIGNKTVIERIIDQFLAFEVNNFYISINHKSKILKAFFDELNPDYKVNFIYESKPLGTGGSLSLIEDSITNDFILANCDVIFDIDLHDLTKFHEKNSNIITIVASTKELTLPYGNLILSEDGNLKATEEKPSFDFLVNTGMYVVSSSILGTIKKDTKIDFTEIIDLAIKNRYKVGVYPISDEEWVDTGQWSEYKKAIEKLS